MGRKLRKNLAISTTAVMSIILMGCPKAAEEEASAVNPKILYISSGACYSGAGITTYTAANASRAVTKWSSTNGASLGIFTDLNVASSVSVGAVPQQLIDKGDHVLMLTENATATGDRKIWKIYKNDPNTYISYANDPTAFSGITRSMTQDIDGSIIFSKTTAMERVNAIGARIVKGGTNPWVNSAGIAGNCFTAAATLIPKINTIAPFTGTNQGKTIYIHSGATAALNRIGAIQRTGMTTATAADCAGSNPAGGASSVAHVNANTLAGPVSFLATGASLTNYVYIPTPAPATTIGKMLVTYSSSVNTAFDNNTNFNQGIVMWDVTEAADTTAATSITFTNPMIVWRDESIVWAPSAIAYDSTDNSVYVAVGGAPGIINQTTANYGYNIEKFTLDIATPSLTRVSTNNQPFIAGNAYTKCVSDISLGE
jgi:hypothetical protein